MNLKYWNADRLTRVENATEFSQLTPVALEILDSMPKPIIQVCGPITTGGIFGSVDLNTEYFSLSIAFFELMGINVFNQIPFEDALHRMVKIWRGNGNIGYCTPILEDFYGPIFESRKISSFYFLPAWETSFGARWEHEQGGKLGIQIVHLEENWVISYMRDIAKKISF